MQVLCVQSSLCELVCENALWRPAHEVLLWFPLLLIELSGPLSCHDPLVLGGGGWKCLVLRNAVYNRPDRGRWTLDVQEALGELSLTAE